MKVVILRIAVPDEKKAQQIAKDLFKDARDMYEHLGAVVLNARVVGTTREDQMIYKERTAEEG
jgi:hypothetical protein